MNASIANPRLGYQRFTFDEQDNLTGWLIRVQYDVVVGDLVVAALGEEVDVLPLLNPGDRNHAKMAATAVKEYAKGWPYAP